MSAQQDLTDQPPHVPATKAPFQPEEPRPETPAAHAPVQAEVSEQAPIQAEGNIVIDDSNSAYSDEL